MNDNFYEKLNEYGLTTKFLVKVSPTDSVRFEAVNYNYKIEEIITSLNFVKEF